MVKFTPLWNPSPLWSQKGLSVAFRGILKYHDPPFSLQCIELDAGWPSKARFLCLLCHVLVACTPNHMCCSKDSGSRVKRTRVPESKGLGFPSPPCSRGLGFPSPQVTLHGPCNGVLASVLAHYLPFSNLGQNRKMPIYGVGSLGCLRQRDHHHEWLRK